MHVHLRFGATRVPKVFVPFCEGLEYKVFSSLSKIMRLGLAIYATLIGITATSVIYSSTPPHVVIQYMAIFVSMVLVLVPQACGGTTRTLKEKWFSRNPLGDAAIAATLRMVRISHGRPRGAHGRLVHLTHPTGKQSHPAQVRTFIGPDLCSLPGRCAP